MSYHYVVFSQAAPEFFQAIHDELQRRGVTGLQYRTVGPGSTFRQYRVPDTELSKLHQIKDQDGFTHACVTATPSVEPSWPVAAVDLYQTSNVSWEEAK